MDAKIHATDPGPRYNIAPSQTLPICRQPAPGTRELVDMEWGLVPADGFYEWRQGDDKPKQPYWIRLKEGEPMAFAGIWEHWEGEIDGEPNDLVGRLHNRMPVILAPEDWGLWLDPEIKEQEALQPLLQPYPPDQMEAIPVSRRVNSPSNDDPGLIERVGESG